MKKIFNNIINTVKNYRPPKFVIFFFFLLPIVVCYIRNLQIDNDTWFLLNHGRYVFEHGIPHIEPFSMHQGLSFVMQQWLSASIFWIVYKYLGEIGLRILIIIIFSLIMFIIYKLGMFLSDKKFYLASSISIMSGVLLSAFMVSRPQIFTYLILIFEIYLLELYIRKKDKKYLYFLPLLSLLQINLHASMWFMLFLFMLPYLVDSFNINFGFIKTEGHNKKPLFIVLFIMLLVGLINPYGIDAVTYIWGSYGIESINKVVGEMKPMSFNTYGLIGYTTIFGVFFVYVFYKKAKIKLRYFLLLCGTLYLTLSHVRNFPLFILSTLFPISEYLKKEFCEYKDKKYPKYFIYFYKVSCVMLLVFVCCFFYNHDTKFTKQSTKAEILCSTNYILKNYNK